MASKRFDLQERILEAEIGEMDWNNGVGKSKSIVLSSDNLTIYVNGIEVSGELKNFRIEDEKLAGKPKYSFVKREYTGSWTVDDRYPVYKLVFGNDLDASKMRFNDIRNRYYNDRSKLTGLWQREE